VTSAASNSATAGIARYRAVLATPHALSLTLAGLAGRLGQAALGLAILLGVRHVTGSFVGAGLAVGLLGAAGAVSRIAQGSLIDRRGVARVLVMASLAEAAVQAALAIAVHAHASLGVLVGLAALTGAAMPALAPGMRSIWAGMFPRSEVRIVAYALESTVTDLAFVLGPAMIAALAATVPAAAIAVAGTGNAVGGLLVGRSQAAANSRSPGPSDVGVSERLGRSVLVPVALTLSVGIVLGSLDVAVPDFVIARGAAGTAGVPLGLWSVGSVAGGLWFGARRWRSSVALRAAWSTLALTAGCSGLLLAGSTTALDGLMILAGLPSGVSMTAAYLLVDERVPRRRVTEAFGWVSSAIPAGAAAGTALAGTLIGVAGASAGLLEAAVAAFSGTAVAWVSLRAGGGSRR
jgi:hypothetical protein